ncbi:MAG: Wzz/FepE/Etk N-terminal domain-containing protein [Candidatus Margulisiibacteriota bacterium]
MEDEINIKKYLEVIARRWLIIAAITFGFALFFLVSSLRESPVFEAKTTILIRSGGGSSSLSQYAGLAGMLGINVGGGSNIGDLTELIKSQAVAGKVLDDLKLRQRIKGWNNPELKRQELTSAISGMIKPPKANGNIIEIKAEAGEAQLSADIANGFVAALSFYWNQLNFTEAQKKLQYIQSELPKVRDNLDLVEGKMRLISTGPGNYGAVQRDYEIYNSIYTMLRKEYESTKLEAAKEIPPFVVVDPAEKPLRKIRPIIRNNVMIGFVLGLFIGLLAAFFQEYWQNEKMANLPFKKG